MSNKKKYILIGIGVIILMSFFLNSGGSDNSTTETEETKEIIVKAAQTEIKGDLKGCYEVVDKNYKIKYDYGYVITVELKRTNKELPYERDNVTIFSEGDKSTAEKCAGFGIEILDANGDVIDKRNAQGDPYSRDEMAEALQLLPDETTTIKFKCYEDEVAKAASFRVTSLVQKNEKKQTNSIESEAKSLVDAVKEASKLTDDEDLKKTQEDAERAIKAAGKTMELAGKMLDILGE